VSAEGTERWGDRTMRRRAKGESGWQARRSTCSALVFHGFSLSSTPLRYARIGPLSDLFFFGSPLARVRAA